MPDPDPLPDPARRMLKPAPDRRVRKPDGTLLDAGGEAVVFDSYWQRRLDDGDVVEPRVRAATQEKAA